VGAQKLNETKGGSFLCTENYCLNYRSSARRDGLEYRHVPRPVSVREVRSPANTLKCRQNQQTLRGINYE